MNQFSHYPWLDLNFRITAPFYYSYNYEGKVLSDCTGKACKKMAKMTYFAATASACLVTACRWSGTFKDSEGKVRKSDCDSGYIIVGGPHGTISGIYDNSDFTIAQSCGKALTSQIGQKIDFSQY